MSGDGVAGGAFETSFVVVPSGGDPDLHERCGPDNQRDRQQHHLCPARLRGRSAACPPRPPNGSLAQPYPALAPEGDPNAASTAYPGQLATYNPEHDPNGGLNSSQFFLSGFNPAYDFSGTGRVRAVGPLRRIATGLPGAGRGRGLAGHTAAQSDHRPDHPADLQPSGAGQFQHGHQCQRFGSLRHDAGLRGRVNTQAAERVALRAEPGQRLEVLGGSTPSTQVNFTSYNDASIGGASNGNPGHHPPRRRLGRHCLPELRRGLCQSDRRLEPDSVPSRATLPAFHQG